MKYFAWFSGAILGFSGIILGAIGAHALEGKLKKEAANQVFVSPESSAGQDRLTELEYRLRTLESGALAEAGKQKRMSNWDTASRYQLFHALFLVITGLLSVVKSSRWLSASAVSAIAGVLIFSGSLYLYAATGNTSFAMVTPAGGVALISAWALLFIHFLVTRKNS